MLLALTLVSTLALGNFAAACFMAWRWVVVVRRNALRAHYVDPAKVGVFSRLDGRYIGSVADLMRETLPEASDSTGLHHEIPDQNEVN